MKNLVRRVIVFLSFTFMFSANGTTYPKLSLGQFNHISDASVIVVITKADKAHSETGELCGFIGHGEVIESFKGPRKSESITFNLYSGMEPGEHYHLMLQESTSKESHMSSTNSMFIEHELKEKQRCKLAPKPIFNILMQGIGATKIQVDASGQLENAVLFYSNNWIVPPEGITIRTHSEGWEGKAEVKYSDLIKYLKSIYQTGQPGPPSSARFCAALRA